MKYDFYCPTCHKEVEVELTMQDYTLIKGQLACCECGTTMHRHYTPVPFCVPRGKLGNARNGYRDEIIDMVYGEKKNE